MSLENLFNSLQNIFSGGQDQPPPEEEQKSGGLMSSSLRPRARPTDTETDDNNNVANFSASVINSFNDPAYNDDEDATAATPAGVTLNSIDAQNVLFDPSTLHSVYNSRMAKAGANFTVAKQKPKSDAITETIDYAEKLAQDTMLTLARTEKLPPAQVGDPGYVAGTASVGALGEPFDVEYDTRSIQQNLVDKGYDIAVDGIIGPQTKKAIKDFQKKSGLKVDGIVGPNTSKALGFESSSSDVTTEVMTSPVPGLDQMGVGFQDPDIVDPTTGRRYTGPGLMRQQERLRKQNLPLFEEYEEDAKEAANIETPFMAAMASEAPTINITKDDRNTKEGIKKIQGVLNVLGYNAGTEDGISGDTTKAAIKQFQKDNKLSPDAVVGNATAAALNKANQSSVSDDVKTDSIIKNIPLPEGVKKSLGNINTVLKAVLSPVGRNFITDMLYGGKLSYANPLKAIPFLNKQTPAGAEVFSQEAIDLMRDIVLDAGIVKKGSVTIGDEIYKKAGNISVSQRGGSSAKEIIEALAEGDPINELKLMLGQFSANIDKNNDIIVTDRFNYNAFINPIDNKKYTPEQYDKAIKDGKFTEAEVLKSIFKGDLNYKTIRAVGFVLGSKDYEGKDNPKDQGRRFKINLGPAN